MRDAARGLRLVGALISAAMPAAHAAGSEVEPRGCEPAALEAALERVRTHAAAPGYVEDGAADATIWTSGPDDGPPPELGPLLACPEAAGPLLVRHLDDARASTATVRSRRTAFAERPVPFGHVCLDLLLGFVRGSHDPPWIDGCADDGLGACVRDAFYFRPDGREPGGAAGDDGPRAAAVRANWERLVADGGVSFSRPEWLPDAP